MRARTLVLEWPRAQGRLLHESCDIRRRDLGQVTVFVTKAKFQELSYEPPCILDCLFAHAALPAKIILPFQPERPRTLLSGAAGGKGFLTPISDRNRTKLLMMNTGDLRRKPGI